MILYNDPKQITNWLTPLEKIYDEEKKDRQRQHAALKETWRQREAATFTADDFAEGLNNLTAFSKTLKSISTQREQKEFDNFEEGWDNLDFNHTDKAEQALKEIDFNKENTNLEVELREKGVDESVIDYIKQKGGHKSINVKRLMGWEKTKDSISTLDARIEADESVGGIRDEYLAAKKTGKVSEFYLKHTKADLTKLGLNKKFLATHYLPSIEKFANAKGLEATLDAKKVIFSQNQEEQIASLENLVGEEDPNVATATVQEFLKVQRSIDPVNGTNNGITLLYKMAKDGKLTPSVIEKMKTGAAIDFAGGKTGDKLLKDRDWDFIEKGYTEYQQGEIAKHELAGTVKLVDLRVKSIKGEISNEELQQGLREAKSAGLGDTDEYKAAEKLNPTRQNEAVYTDERISIEPALKSGNVEFLKQEKERVTNENLKDEIQKTIDRLEGKQKEFQYSEKPIEEMVGKYLDLTVGTDGDYNFTAGQDTINNELTRYFREQFNALSQDPNVLNPYEAAKDATQDYWLRNGGGAAKYREGQPDTDVKNPRGKFTATHNGKFLLYNTYKKAKSARFVELNKVVNEQEFNQIKTNLITNLNAAGESTEVEGKTALERLLNTPEAILSGSELKAVFENNQVSQKILTQAKLLGVTPQEIIAAQFNALAKDDPNKELRNLDQSDIDNFVNPHLYIKEVLNKTKNTDLLYLLNREGVQNFSPKQATRLRKVLAAEAEVDYVAEQADLNFERNKRLQRLKTLGITNVPASALESDEALDKFIAQQGGLEPQYTEGEL